MKEPSTPVTVDSCSSSGEAASSEDSSLTGNTPPMEESPLRRMLAAKHQEPPIYGSVIGPTKLSDIVIKCPCCQQRNPHSQLKINEPKMEQQSTLLDTSTLRKQNSLVQSSDSEDGSVSTTASEQLPGGELADGRLYQPQTVLVEGWLHKKGTGHDWLGSRAWKPRWARLALAHMHGMSAQVPLLLIYWHPYTTTASNAILLDKSVVLTVDLDDKERWNAHRFEIRDITEHQDTRTFSAPHKARDSWVYAISQALLTYEKKKRSPVRHTVTRPTSPVARSLSTEVRPPLSPPSSPPYYPRLALHSTKLKHPPILPGLPPRSVVGKTPVVIE